MAGLEDQAFAIVLSGTGSDGACGLRAVGASGGFTFVQAPESALFDAMPSAAITLGHPDVLATVDHGPEDPENHHPHLLNQAIQRLKEATGIDFSQYKETTLCRQLHRRLAVTGTVSMEAYVQRLASCEDLCHRSR
ncbi:MAG: hypothetical protein FJ083_17525 [Cyanobacteria bacterium K_Offshore_surface_m2_239]|nr:hypothetical protein [Cyanobacteria bacterium K_Offshore_surface_m2_239]